MKFLESEALAVCLMVAAIVYVVKTENTNRYKACMYYQQQHCQVFVK